MAYHFLKVILWSTNTFVYNHQVRLNEVFCGLQRIFFSQLLEMYFFNFIVADNMVDLGVVNDANALCNQHLVDGARDLFAHILSNLRLFFVQENDLSLLVANRIEVLFYAGCRLEGIH